MHWFYFGSAWTRTGAVGAAAATVLACFADTCDINGGTHYGLDFTPVDQLVHVRVRLRPAMEIRKDPKKAGTASCSFTLLEVLGEIYWEIGFYGNPEDRDRESADLRRHCVTTMKVVPAVPIDPPRETQD